MEVLHQFTDIILYMDTHLNQWMNLFGPWIYVILFFVIFCETGLVVTPFLPGDSLLFALGALAASQGSTLRLSLLAVVLILASVVGDSVNYTMGHYLGPRVFKKKDSWWFRKENLLRTQAFYDRHGGKTIVLARFMPIIRTFAPFVAGIGRMRYRRFMSFNIFGGAGWVLSFLLAGYFFGNLPMVKHNFHMVILVIIFLSCLPGLIHYLKSQKSLRRARDLSSS